MNFPSYPAYKDSGVEWLGDVPQSWSVYSLKRTVDGCVNGLWGDEPDGENDIAVIRVADFERSFSTVGLDKLTYRSITPKERQSRLIKSGDLLIEKSGGGEKTLVGCVVLFTHGVDAITSNFVARMRPLPEFDSQFLSYAFGNLYHGRVNYPSVKQVTGIQNLDAESYLQERFCFPARVEQTQIARFLDHETADIDALIEEQQRLIELLKEKRQAVISHSVTKGLDPTVPMKDSGVEWLGEVPAHWRSRKVKRLFAQSKRQGYTDMEVLSVYRDYGVVKKNSRDDNNNKTPDDLSLYQLVMAGDLVVNKMKAWQGSLGVSEYQGITSPDYVVYSPSHGEAPKFLHYLLRASHMPKVYLSISNGIRPSQWRIEPEKFEQVEVFLPGKREQLEIVTYLENQLTRINVLMLCCEQASNFFSERRSALISAAVTGKIDVRGWQPLASAPTPELAQEAV